MKVEPALKHTGLPLTMFRGGETSVKELESLNPPYTSFLVVGSPNVFRTCLDDEWLLKCLKDAILFRKVVEGYRKILDSPEALPLVLWHVLRENENWGTWNWR